MSMTLASSSRTITLPKYAREGLVELIKANYAKNYPLGGNLYVDFYNTRGGWTITFDAIPVEDYDTIRAVHDDQFANSEFLTLNDPDLGITDLSVFLTLPDERNLVWNKQAVLDLEITLEPENANS